MKCAIVDVFAENRYAGNQLAVVLGADALDADAMQSIAREMNFSETTFVVAQDEASARVRIFTPTRELPFAGHPTVGTAWVLGRHQPEYTLKLAAGNVSVTFDASGIVWMTPPRAKLGAAAVGAEMASLIGIVEADLDPDFPPRHAVVGPSFVLIGVRSLDALKRIRLDADMHRAMSGDELFSVFVFSSEPYDAAGDFSARMFFDANGIREDAATGSANTAFAYYLADLGRAGMVTVQQGFEIERPSHLYLDIGEPVRVGGRVQQVVEGELWFDAP